MTVENAINILAGGGCIKANADGNRFEIRSKLSFGVAWYGVFQNGEKVRDYLRLSDSQLFDWLSHLQIA